MSVTRSRQRLEINCEGQQPFRRGFVQTTEMSLGKKARCLLSEGFSLGFLLAVDPSDTYCCCRLKTALLAGLI